MQHHASLLQVYARYDRITLAHISKAAGRCDGAIHLWYNNERYLHNPSAALKVGDAYFKIHADKATDIYCASYGPKTYFNIPATALDVTDPAVSVMNIGSISNLQPKSDLRKAFSNVDNALLSGLLLRSVVTKIGKYETNEAMIGLCDNFVIDLAQLLDVIKSVVLEPDTLTKMVCDWHDFEDQSILYLWSNVIAAKDTAVKSYSKDGKTNAVAAIDLLVTSLKRFRLAQLNMVLENEHVFFWDIGYLHVWQDKGDLRNLHRIRTLEIFSKPVTDIEWPIMKKIDDPWPCYKGAIGPGSVPLPLNYLRYESVKFPVGMQLFVTRASTPSCDGTFLLWHNMPQIPKQHHNIGREIFHHKADSMKPVFNLKLRHGRVSCGLLQKVYGITLDFTLNKGTEAMKMLESFVAAHPGKNFLFANFPLIGGDNNIVDSKTGMLLLENVEISKQQYCFDPIYGPMIVIYPGNLYPSEDHSLSSTSL
jgi:hypothetical protein